MELANIKTLLSLVDKDHGVKVESSNIEKIGHSGNNPGYLVIKFNNGSAYSYYPVSTEAFHGILQAPSSGKYFNEHIRSNKTITTTKLKDKA